MVRRVLYADVAALGVNLSFCHSVMHCCIIEETGFKGAGYSDPTTKIYQQLGLGSNLEMGPSGDQKKSYLKGSMLKSHLTSLGVRILLAKPSRFVTRCLPLDADSEQ